MKPLPLFEGREPDNVLVSVAGFDPDDSLSTRLFSGLPFVPFSYAYDTLAFMLPNGISEVFKLTKRGNTRFRLGYTNEFSVRGIPKPLNV